VPTETITQRLPKPLAQTLVRAIGRTSPALLTYLGLTIAWIVVAPRSPDLAAQIYRTYLFTHFGMVVWDNNWYGGHLIPGYSLVYPPLSAVIGVRLLGALAVLASTVLFSRIAAIVYGPKTTLACVFFTIAAAGDLWIGRITFALGVTFALASMLALLSSRRRSSLALAVALGITSALTSPVAGALLALAIGTEIVARRRLSRGTLVIVAIVIVLIPLELLFPEGGFEPYGFNSFAASTAVGLGFIFALPKGERLLRTGGWLFLLVNAIGLLPTPMGSNVVRYAVLLAGPLLLAAYARPHAQSEGRRPLWAVALVLVGIGFWVLWGPITQSKEVLNDPSTRPSFYMPVRDFLAAYGGGRPVRIEVPFTRSHWEAALLAPYVSLARGWERQLDKRYDEAIEEDPLNPAVYHRWLAHDAVSYVALPDVPLDGSSLGEAALIRHGAPFLKEVFSDKSWKIYEVLGTRPLAEGPGKLTALTHEGFTLRAKSAGSFLVRVHYTHYWSVVSGAAKISPAGEGWTRVKVRRPGAVRVQARFSLGAALEEL
jgi:hypothetical protein